MMTTLSGLRVYINSPALNGLNGSNGSAVKPEAVKVDQVFYSRRASGPTYRWLYEQELDHWRPRRMNTKDFDSHKLSLASWKSVPDSLQAQLVKHYLD